MKFNSKRTLKKAGFTLPELLVVVSTILLLTSVAMAYMTKARDKSISSRLSMDFAEIKKVFEMYSTQNAQEPCHLHNMSNDNEKIWSVGYIKTWPTSPMRSKYFISHTGPVGAPTPNDFYYIGVVLDQKTASLFENQYDDGNPSTGLFRSQTSPSNHYSFQIQLTTLNSHTHCP